MGPWKGLDPGGAEALLHPDVLMSTLEIFLAEAPFNRHDPTDHVYDALEQYRSDFAWRSTDSSGTFRPIFRARNVWAKLGLIEDSPNGTTVSLRGEELLTGQLSVAEVFALAAKEHPEGQTHPYRIMCRAFLEDPTHLFTPEEVEYGISAHFVPGSVSVAEALTRASRVRTPLSATRSRRIRGFMQSLESSGAATYYDLSVRQPAWGAGNPAVLRGIAGIAGGRRIITAPPGPSARRPRRRSWHAGLPPAGSTGGAQGAFTPSGNVSDPAARLDALEKGNQLHQEIVVMAADRLRAMGLDAREDPNSFDIGVRGGPDILVEVKSIHRGNAVGQLRRGIAQLFEYRWACQMPGSTRLVLALSADPRSWIPRGYVEFIEQDLGIEVFWRSGSNLVDRHSTKF